MPQSDTGIHEDLKKDQDTRTFEQRKIDDDYNTMVARIVGEDAVDVPMKRQLNTRGQGLVLVVTDPSDLGYQFVPSIPPARLPMGELAAAAVAFAFEVVPADESD